MNTALMRKNLQEIIRFANEMNKEFEKRNQAYNMLRNYEERDFFAWWESRANLISTIANELFTELNHKDLPSQPKD